MLRCVLFCFVSDPQAVLINMLNPCNSTGRVNQPGDYQAAFQWNWWSRSCRCIGRDMETFRYCSSFLSLLELYHNVTYVHFENSNPPDSIEVPRRTKNSNSRQVCFITRRNGKLQRYPSNPPHTVPKNAD